MKKTVIDSLKDGDDIRGAIIRMRKFGFIGKIVRADLAHNSLLLPLLVTAPAFTWPYGPVEIWMNEEDAEMCEWATKDERFLYEMNGPYYYDNRVFKTISEYKAMDA